MVILVTKLIMMKYYCSVSEVKTNINLQFGTERTSCGLTDNFECICITTGCPLYYKKKKAKS